MFPDLCELRTNEMTDKDKTYQSGLKFLSQNLFLYRHFNTNCDLRVIVVFRLAYRVETFSTRQNWHLFVPLVCFVCFSIVQLYVFR